MALPDDFLPKQQIQGGEKARNAEGGSELRIWTAVGADGDEPSRNLATLRIVAKTSGFGGTSTNRGALSHAHAPVTYCATRLYYR